MSDRSLSESLPHDLDEIIAALQDVEGAAESLASSMGEGDDAEKARTVQHAIRGVNKDLSELRSELD